MFSFEGEYSHPYIDDELNIPGMREYVEKLIDEELRSMILNENYCESDEDEPACASFALKELGKEADYEDLLQRRGLMKLLLKKRSEYWRKEGKSLYNEICTLNEQIKGLEEDIDKITLERKRLQESQKVKLRRLLKREKTAKENIDKLNVMIENEKKLE